MKESEQLLTPARDLTPIVKLFRKRKSIAALYVFGSAATGRERWGSDIDLAVMTRKPFSTRARINLETTLGGLLRRDVDLVVFGQAPPLLQHQILKYGRLICENDPSERVRQEVHSRAEYLDTRELFKEIPLSKNGR